MTVGVVRVGGLIRHPETNERDDGAGSVGQVVHGVSGDGNGALLLPNVTYEFTYAIKKDQISIDYENESVRDGTYIFTAEDNTLTLIGGEGTVGGTYTLTRVEEE